MEVSYVRTPGTRYSTGGYIPRQQLFTYSFDRAGLHLHELAVASQRGSYVQLQLVYTTYR